MMRVASSSLLVVSPHPAARRLLQLLLGEAGFVAYTACDGDEALAHMSRRPEVVLLDVRAPDEDMLLLLGLLQRRHAAVPRVLLHEGQARLVVGDQEDLLSFGEGCGGSVFPSVADLKDLVGALMLERQLRVFRPPSGDA